VLERLAVAPQRFVEEVQRGVRVGDGVTQYRDSLAWYCGASS
jgi:hypothetical protein